MNRIASLSILLRMMILIVICMSCKKDKDPEPTPVEPTLKEKAATLMTANGGKWNPAAVTNWVMVEGVNVSDLFENFTITFTATGYTTTGTSPVWPRTDTWHFKNDDATSFIRDSDGKEVTIKVTETTMEISLMWDQTLFDGRSKSVKGRHVFTLTK